MTACIQTEILWCASRTSATEEVVSAVVPVEICHHADPRQELAFGGSLPPIHVYTSATECGKGIALSKRVPEKDIPAGWNLGLARGGQEDKNEDNGRDLAQQALRTAANRIGCKLDVSRMHLGLAVAGVGTGAGDIL